MKNGATTDTLLVFGFHKQHHVLKSLIQHVDIVEHHTPDCALAAAISQTVTAALLCSTSDENHLMAMAGRWYAHPSTKNRPLVLIGCDDWNPDDMHLANRITADTYLPSNITPTLVLETIDRLKARFSLLTENEPTNGITLTTFNDKLETILREQATLQTLSITQMAHDAGMSISRFQRTVKRVTGRSPIEYMNHIKLMKARQLLVMRSGTVSDIAYQCGFNSVAYFCKQFKREYGKTPGEMMM
jgi:AraC-like DNA-binding protein